MLPLLSSPKSLIFLLALLLSLPMGVLFAAPTPPEPSPQRMTPTVQAVRKALPWVVSIGTTQQILQVNDPFSLFFTDFFCQPNRVLTQYSPLGSGVILDSSGLVMTNYHVVRRASSIQVQLWDGTALVARMVGYDVPNDLCLLKLENPGKPLAPAEFAAVQDLYLGETVIAIGNPFGLGQSVSTGVLSALNRSFREGEVSFEELLQTDAAINPGNSGGPLVNLDGQVVGINQAIRADAQGIGFAIPLSHIENFLSYWLKPSHFSDAYLGMEPTAILELGDDQGGVVLPEILPDSPLQKAGLAQGDRILSVNGIPVRRPLDWGKAIWSLQKGDVLTLETSRGECQVTAEPMPDELLLKTRLGLEVTDLNDTVASALGLRQGERGVVITQIFPDLPGGDQVAQWRQLLRRGDIVLKFADQEAPSLADMARLLRENSAGQHQYVVFYCAAVKMPVEVARFVLH
ncbi:MAG: trypsin-like peptidase domain-containing protein [Oligosphaeraceae bacterium]